MKIAFHGAAQTVTGSKHLLTLKNGKKILLDCGMFQGLGKETGNLNASFGFDAKEIDVMILSHAHIDHSGLIPKLYNEGFKGAIYCTPATYDLAKVLLEDSATIQRDDTRFLNKRREKSGLPPVEPLYSIEDATNSFALFDKKEYEHWFKVTDGVQAMFTDAGHIIGSASVHLKITENGKVTKLTFSGDVGRYRDLILKSPEPFPQADYIIIESTYGDKLHEDTFSSLDTFYNYIHKTCIEKKGKLIIPAFSVGRTQELLYMLNQLSLEKRLPKIPVYVDSPLSHEATEIVKSYPKYFNSRVKKVLEIDDDPFDFSGLSFIGSADESKALNFNPQPMIIISASGMADAGRIKHHIANNIHDRRNTILIVGYCEPNSLGGRIVNGAKEVRIFGEMHKVIAEIAEIHTMSAHGDYDDLCQYLSCQNPALVNKVFVVHGEPDVMFEFQKRLVKKGFKDVETPKMHQEFTLE
ncbi:MAG: MBL fold metallo-hydrolase [Chitinophagaceae bacterium]|nr:MBL fold metallo-hydrolase [Chitinophagaceae bacterium]MCW5905890.1 MBL fold metallo-hydrolase [Chitinophagaceae bacterium]